MPIDPAIKELSSQLNVLFDQIMESEPADPGYGEVVAIHSHLASVVRDRAQLGMVQFKEYLATTERDLAETWSTNKGVLNRWSKYLTPVFNLVGKILGKASPLLALL